jgi:hypothetical protein
MREKIRYDPEISERLVRVLYFRAHRFVCPFANSLRQIFELLHPGR